MCRRKKSEAKTTSGAPKQDGITQEEVQTNAILIGQCKTWAHFLCKHLFNRETDNTLTNDARLIS